MSFYIDATTPELSNYVPNSGGLPLPPMGSYPGVFQVVGGEPGETKNKEPKFVITFECVDGNLQGQRFQVNYNTGASNAIARRIAIQSIMDIAAGITGMNYTGQRFAFDEKMYFKPFIGTFVVSPQINKDNNQPALDDSGNPRKNAKFTGIKPMSSQQPQQPQVSAQAHVGYPQQAHQPVGQPQTASAPTPPWQAR